MSIATKLENHKSRFGFHPCDYETFSKLCELHKAYWQTVYDFHRWHRWNRKEPQNRKGPEPAYCKIFVENKPWWKQFTHNGEKGLKYYPKTVTDHGIVDLYQRARMPQTEQVEPFDGNTILKINKLYAQLKKELSK